MRLVAQALQRLEGGAAARQRDGGAVLAHHGLLALGEPDERDLAGADALERGARRPHLPHAAVDNDQVGARQLARLDPRPVALDRLADHGEVVGTRPPDAHAPVEALARAPVLARHHRRDRALGTEVRDVEAHHPVGRARQPEHALQIGDLGREAGAAAGGARLEVLEREGRVALRRRQQASPAAALRDLELDRMPGVGGQRFGGGAGIGGIVRAQDQARQLGTGEVVLDQEGLEQRGIVEPAAALDHPRLLADHAPAAQQQHRRRRPPPVAREPHHVGVTAARPHHLLGHPRPLEQADLIAAPRRHLVAPRHGGFRHLALEAMEQIAVAAGQEQQQAVDQPAVVLRGDPGPRGAGTDAALDVVVEARPVGALVVLEVTAGAHREDAADLAQGAAQALDVGIGTQVARAVGAHVTRHREARPLLLDADPDVRVALVVLEQDVVMRMVLADEGGLEQQRLGLGLGQDGIEVGGRRHELAQARVLELAAEVAAHPVEQALGLADVEHPSPRVLPQVNPRKGRQILDFFAHGAHGSLRTPEDGRGSGNTTPHPRDRQRPAPRSPHPPRRGGAAVERRAGAHVARALTARAAATYRRWALVRSRRRSRNAPPQVGRQTGDHQRSGRAP